MSRWKYEPERARVRNGTVLSVSGGMATVRLDDGYQPTIPVYGKVAAGRGCLVVEQGGALIALGPGGTADPPRWRGKLPDVTVPHNSVTRLSGVPAVYTADRITVSNGIATVAEAGLYSIGLRWGYNHRPTSTERNFLELMRDGLAYRVPGGQEDSQSGSWLVGCNDGDALTWQAYQAMGAAYTLSGLYLQVIKVGEL